MQETISKEKLEAFSEQFHSDPRNEVAMRAVVSGGVNKAAANHESLRRQRHEFSISLKQGEITNQKQSGRCWMFAALNTMRFQVIKKLNLETFELSQSYPLFFDKLEKSNYFLESILETLEEPTDGRLIAYLLQDPLGDGGQWDMFCSLVEKYGVVPKDVMPESVSSSATREMSSWMTRKLREYACILRTAYRKGACVEELRARKDEMMDTVYRMLCICLGEPPKSFTFEVRDKDDRFIRDRDITPQEFYAKYVGLDLSQYISLINAPTADKPYGRAFTVRFLGNVRGGRLVRYLNVTSDELKQAAIRQLQDQEPVWFGCDVGAFSLRDGGLLDLDCLKTDALFNTQWKLDKAERLDYGQSLMTHAMVFTGVNLDESGRPDRWRVENSWGKEAGKDGYYVMSDEWFDEYTYQVVVNRKYLTKEQLEQYESEPVVLEPWDPMGSLA